MSDEDTPTLPATNDVALLGPTPQVDTWYPHHALLVPRETDTRDSHYKRTYFNPGDDATMSTMVVKGQVCYWERCMKKTIIYIGAAQQRESEVMYDLLTMIMLEDGRDLKGAKIIVPWTLRTHAEERLIAVTVPDDVQSVSEETLRRTQTHQYRLEQQAYNILEPQMPLASELPLERGMVVDCTFHLHTVGRQIKTPHRERRSFAYKWVLEAVQLIKYRPEETLFLEPIVPRLVLVMDGKAGRMLDLIAGTETTVDAEQQGVLHLI
uniref:Uncharacterized protein n=1 Tax=Mycena chlorophos TaxID=658473 RepID=A0ABQ0LJD3_MYCCL|nr:predicted protein [Mycena chlorophos]